jgi:hypothetical protein
MKIEVNWKLNYKEILEMPEDKCYDEISELLYDKRVKIAEILETDIDDVTLEWDEL